MIIIRSKRASIFFLLVFSVLTVEIKGRSLKHGSHRHHHHEEQNSVISDGVDEEGNDFKQISNILLVKSNFMYSNFSLFSPIEEEEEECEQMYGFLPCSTNIYGHLFLIIVYEYLLIKGESLAAAGGEKIFKILGTGVFGASAFHVLSALPEALILLACGLLSSEEVAEEYVYTGVGMLAGSSIFLLTLVWATCVLVASQDFSNPSNSSPLSLQTLKARILGYGVDIDKETSYTARTIFITVIPFLLLQIPRIFNLSSEGTVIVILITLFISVIVLILSFIYQVFEPWVQERRLEFLKHQHLTERVLQHVQKHALRRLLTHDGAPNVRAIRRLFKEIDEDGDDVVSYSEVKELFLQIKGLETGRDDTDQAISEAMKMFDLDGDQKVNEDEFVSGFTKLLDSENLLGDINRQYDSRKSLTNIYQVIHPWLQNKKKEKEIRKNLMLQILKQSQSNVLESHVTEDGAPNIPFIRRMFDRIDQDGDNKISQSELKKMIADVKFGGQVSLDVDEAVWKIVEELDGNGDREIDEEEFINGICKLFDRSNKLQAPASIEFQDDVYQKTWEETDKLVGDETKSNGVVDRSIWTCTKAIMQLIIGIFALGLLAEPLIHSVENFSNSLNIASFFVSFILVPLSTNFRAAIVAITAANRRTPRTTSLTFSEIYSGVFMNNILGISVLLFLIYVRGMTWDFSAEFLIVLLVCALMASTTGFHNKFPVWTCFVAFLLYPLSLLMVYILNYVLDYV